MADGEARFTADVVEVIDLNPIFRRVVLGGPGLAGYVSTRRADEWFRFVFGVDQRYYTIRRYDPSGPMITVDVMVHGHGIASSWVGQVQAGDQVDLTQAWGRYDPAPDAEWELIIADPTGLPAACRILDELPAGRRAIAILEAPGPDCRLKISTAAELTLHWLDSPDLERGVGQLAAATRDLELPAGPGYVWMGGEQACSRDIRKYFRKELGWGSERYDIVGYWRPDAETYRKRYKIVENRVAEIYERGMAAGQDSEDILDEALEIMEAHQL